MVRGGVVVVVVVVMLAALTRAQNINVRDWMGEEPLTPQRIVEDLVEYFSQRDPHGIPVLDVPEPLTIPGERSASGITLYDATISGHSGLRLEYVNVNITSLSAMTRITMPFLNIFGDYDWPGYWGSSSGEANITLVAIQATTELYLGVNNQGLLTVEDVRIDFVYDDLKLDFTGLSYTHSLLVGTASTFFSTVIQPFVVGGAQSKIMDRINERMKQRLAHLTFPDSISPADYAVTKVRNRIREMNMDPFKANKTIDQNLTWGVTIQLKNVAVSGISTIHRTHEVSFQFIDNAVFVTLQIGTQTLAGGADWSLSAALMPGVGGHLDLEIESLAITIEIKQPANIRSPPTLRKIDVQLGNIAVRSGGEGTMDYIVEAAVNILPNALRNVIMNKLEPKIHQIIQREMNKMDLYRIVMNKLAERGGSRPLI
ncbi:hypothetical protein Pcinc_039776 [Petrolisthes cinctipes]|uniref:Uncharacterized protein n=1 Tax=Petrolisthes cinctipes TaxID=88211 RepID=A0AAE1BNH6_PETCI|nr:hypothetical protein Pcinc_039776 [Petrolisthes cinctipes]